MTKLNLVTANMVNLADLWKTIGATRKVVQGTSVYTCNQWPHRVWVDVDYPFDPAAMDALLTELQPLPEQVVFPVWREVDEPLIEVFQKHGLVPNFQQMNMVLDFQAGDVDQLARPTELEFRHVSTPEQATIWAQIGGEAFSPIDHGAVQGLVGNPSVVMILAYKGDTPVATTMVYDDGVVAGYHTVGVPERFRRQGIARAIMSHALVVGEEMGRPYATLQASTMGEPLYAQFGFERQFLMTSFRRG